MGAPVWGLVAMIVVVLLAQRFGYDWREGATLLRIAAALFCVSIVLEGAVVSSRDSESILLPLLAAGLGWFCLVLAVFDIADPDESPVPVEDRN